jgi:BirA family biotin operon repressor/biotin-[acetyl-CoA-carboxylase] ligase
VLLGGRKVAGVLAEGRPQEGWAVLGIGVNLVLEAGLPDDVRRRAGTLGRRPEEADAVLSELLGGLERRLDEPPAAALGALRERDALLGAAVRWADGTGTAAGIDDRGRLVVRGADGRTDALDAGEVHLLAEPA